MRIAFILNEFPSVSQTFILNQVIGLIEQGHIVKVFATRKEAAGNCNTIMINKYNLVEKTKYMPVMPQSKIKIMCKAFSLLIKHFNKKPLSLLGTLNIFKYGKDALNFSLLYRAIPFIDNNIFDLVHCQFGQHGVKGVRLRELGFFKAKVITSFRGHDLSNYLKLKGDSVYAELFKKGDLFLPVSDYFKERLIELGCDEKRIIVHRSGINLKQFKWVARNISDKQSIKLLSIGRLVEKKGYEYSIKAIAKLVDNNNYNIKYRIIGDGPLMDNLNSLITKLDVGNYVEMLGTKSHDQVLKYIYESHILVTPSVTSADGDQEGIPNVLKEAMATGMPVVSTNHSGIPELVKNGISGFLVPERDVIKLVETIQYMVENSEAWKEIGKAGRKTVEDHYDINKLNNELVDIYMHLQK